MKRYMLETLGARDAWVHRGEYDTAEEARAAGNAARAAMYRVTDIDAPLQWWPTRGELAEALRTVIADRDKVIGERDAARAAINVVDGALQDARAEVSTLKGLVLAAERTANAKGDELASAREEIASLGRRLAVDEKRARSAERQRDNAEHRASATRDMLRDVELRASCLAAERERDRLALERNRLLGWLRRIDGGDSPCRTETQLRRWAMAALRGDEP